MKFDRAQYYQRWEALVNAAEFKTFLAGVDKDPLSNYCNIDWEKADAQTYLKMYWPRNGEMGAIQSDEALFLIELCRELRPENTLEIGTMHGVSTRLLAALAKSYGGRLTSIDGGMSAGVKLNLMTLDLFDRVTLIKEWVPWFLFRPAKEIDLLFIDGDHTLMSIIVDYHYFNYFLKKGGIVIFHDMNLAASQEAVKIIQRRDPLEEIAAVGRMLALRKLTDSYEKYFETMPERKG